ncbi:Predicted arabinose efflux permease, MFS family [Auraticoccus monumenti]|uniref:Predicted arabinose efflux permease, MFS family n=1 Tax=Auraticoccus monumenti TaxID=675864 RepID=A0A1G7C9T4_9ACTN|nr:Predicted arabinose efflux permease, MFS family [Auraticoccus monumenti]
MLRQLVWPAFVPTFLFSVGTGASTPVVLVAALSLGFGQAAAAALVSSLALAAVVGSGPAGLLIARLGERRSMLAAAALSVLSLTACLAALAAGSAGPGGRGLFVAGVLGLALADVFFGLARQTMVAEAVPADVRARAMSTFGGVQRAGRLVGPVLGSGVIALTSVAGGFWVQLVAVLLAAVVVLRVPAGAAGRSALVTLTGGPVARVDVRLVALVLVGVLTLALARGNRDVVLPLWGTELQLDPALISLVFAGVSAVELLLFLPAGVLMDRHGRVAVVVPCLVLVAVGFLLVPLGGLAGYLGGAVLIGIGNGLGAGIVKTLGADLSPEGGRARFLGWWTGAVQLGQVAGPVMISVGALLGALAAAVQLTGVVALLGAGWFLVLRRRGLLR